MDNNRDVEQTNLSQKIIEKKNDTGSESINSNQNSNYFPAHPQYKEKYRTLCWTSRNID